MNPDRHIQQLREMEAHADQQIRLLERFKSDCIRERTKLEGNPSARKIKKLEYQLQSNDAIAKRNAYISKKAAS